MTHLANASSTRHASNPVDIRKYLSKSAASKTESKVKSFYKYFNIPGIGNLAGGLPNHNYFPFVSIIASTEPSFQLRSINSKGHLVTKACNFVIFFESSIRAMCRFRGISCMILATPDVYVLPKYSIVDLKVITDYRMHPGHS